MLKLRNGSKGNLNPGFLDCESDVLPLSQRAPQEISHEKIGVPRNCIKM